MTISRKYSSRNYCCYYIAGENCGGCRTLPASGKSGRLQQRRSKIPQSEEDQLQVGGQNWGV